MRHAALVAVLAGAMAAHAAGQPATHPVSLSDLLTIHQVATPALSPDGRAILYSVRAWEDGTGRNAGRKDARTHIWRVSADGTGQRQLTFGERGERLPTWSPDGAWIAFLAARDGDANGAAAPGGDNGPRAQIWIMPTAGGEAVRLTDAKESVTAYAWSPDSRRMAFVATDPLSKEIEDKHKRRDDAKMFEGDFRFSHLWVVGVPKADGSDAPPASAVELTHDDQLTVRGEPTWSSDSRRVAFAAAPTPMIRDDRSDVYIATVDGATGARAEKITTNLGPDAEPAWSPDGRTIAYLSTPNTGTPLGDGIPLQRVGNEHLMLYDVATRRAKDAAARDFDLAPGAPRWSPDSRRLIFTAGVGAYNDVFAYDVAAGRYSRLTHDRIARLGAVGRDAMALVMESASEPPEIYLAGTDGASLRKLTDTNPHARSFELGQSEVISWKSDGSTIEGVLLKPVGYQPGRRYPLLVVAHGGPTGAHMNGYRIGYGDGGQNWAGEGWAVLYPNPRGSSNYGEKFMQANFNDWGGGDYRDIMAGVDAVIARGIADPDRMAFLGWSYGGYMTCWVVSQTSRFKAAMQGAGISDLASMYGTNDVPNYLGTFFGGVPSKSTMPLYAARSGITYVDQVTTPLLILHGGSDERVPIGQPMEFYRALKDRDKTVELVFYPREGHGFAEYYHQLDRLQRQHDWIVRYTLGGAARKTSQP